MSSYPVDGDFDPFEDDFDPFEELDADDDGDWQQEIEDEIEREGNCPLCRQSLWEGDIICQECQDKVVKRGIAPKEIRIACPECGTPVTVRPGTSSFDFSTEVLTLRAALCQSCMQSVFRTSDSTAADAGERQK